MRVIFNDSCRNRGCDAHVAGQIKNKTQNHVYNVQFICARCETTWNREVIVGVLRESETTPTKEPPSINADMLSIRY